MSITVEGLNARQRVLADILWKLNGRDEVHTFIRSLPREFQYDAETVLSMMLAAVFDQGHDTDLASQVLDKYRK